MIFSSIVPNEIVWDGYQSIDNKALKEVTIDQVTMVIEPISPTEGKIVRIISANPYDYTKPELFPGEIIQYIPSLPTKRLPN